MIPDLRGKAIQSMTSRFSLRLRTADGWELKLAGDTTLSRAGQSPIELDTAVAQDEPIAEVRHLLAQRISAAEVTPQGDLVLHVEETTLTTKVGDDHEAWQIAGPDGERVICMPGGELAVWGPRPD